MNKKNKKGISPLIATVLIIGFTIVLAAMVITWGTKLFKTTTEQTGQTSELNLLCTTGFNVEYTAKKTTGAAAASKIELTASNKNEKPVVGFLFVAKKNSGETVVFNTDSTLPPASSPDPDGTGAGIAATVTITTPTGGASDLGLFATKKYEMKGGTASPLLETFEKVEVRPIALLSNNAKHICENSVLVNVA